MVEFNSCGPVRHVPLKFNSDWVRSEAWVRRELLMATASSHLTGLYLAQPINSTPIFAANTRALQIIQIAAFSIS